jgi:nitroreductase
MKFIKSLIPKRVKVYLKTFRIFIYDFYNFIENSNLLQKFDSEEKLKGKMTLYYHVAEKGLTMPETRFGFGKTNMLVLVSLCELYQNKNYDKNDKVFKHTLNVIQEYVDFHEENNFILEKEYLNKLQLALAFRDATFEKTRQLTQNSNEYFFYSNSKYDEFSKSRFSVRNYSPVDIPLEILHDCINLAQKTPSSCNRQPNRVYIAKNPEKIIGILNLQNGNRGFGHLASTLFVLTSDISIWQGPNDRFQSHFNSGMFSMSLLQALHFNKIGACPLNWSAGVKETKAIKKLLNIPKNEIVTLVISCGYLPDQFKIALSPRLDSKLITTEIL